MTIPVSVLPVVPPGEDDLPCCDGEPMESDRHRKQMNLLIESLDYALRDRNDVFVGGNMFIYYSELQTKRNDFRGPDVFVVLDTVRRERKSWVVWKEDGRMPDVVIELVSETTEHVDRVEKMRLYARSLRVGEYFIYDPMSHRLDGYRLDGGGWKYEPIEPEPDGEFVCRQLGLKLALWHGTIGGIETDWLRWFDATGRPLPTPAEAEAQRAEEEARRAEQEARRAEQEARRAEQEALRAARLEAKLAEYEAKFGKLPDR